MLWFLFSFPSTTRISYSKWRLLLQLESLNEEVLRNSNDIAANWQKQNFIILK
jgi:hypothetical protein